jgi:hypothetical protein
VAKRKGNAPGQGRQPTIAPAGQVARITARVSKQQREEYVRRGASQALRDWLDGKLAAADKEHPVAHDALSDTTKGD